MIVSSAQQMGCKLLWAEDLNSGQYIDDLVIRKPFNQKQWGGLVNKKLFT